MLVFVSIFPKWSFPNLDKVHEFMDCACMGDMTFELINLNVDAAGP